jgi:hypothetical protein
MKNGLATTAPEKNQVSRPGLFLPDLLTLFGLVPRNPRQVQPGILVYIPNEAGTVKPFSGRIAAIFVFDTEKVLRL